MKDRAWLVIGVAAVAACGDSATAPVVANQPPAGSSQLCETPTLAPGGVALITGGSLCLSGSSAGASYAVIPFLANAASSARASITFSASGVASASAAASDRTTATDPRRRVEAEFETALRTRERAELSALFDGARSWQRRQTGGATRTAIPATLAVGDQIQLNANGEDNCTDADVRTARVAAVTDKAVVVADLQNPAGGYTDAEYQSLAIAFDTLVDPLDRRNFGDPSDIDHNGRIVLFFTKAVNDLTGTSSESFIGGFFAARDLFPATTVGNLTGCAASNVGEIFYMMVPDPTRGASFSKSNVSNVAIGTIAHEYQHLINAARRLYVNTSAEDFEEVWLNEGLSHIAEELLFYQVSGLAPRLNIDVNTIRQSQTRIDAFNHYMLANVDRYIEFLERPSDYSPFSDNDSLATRGAAWSYLRYAADQSTKSEQTIWLQLVNATTTGITNLRQVLGTEPVPLARSWATSVYADDAAPVGIPYLQPSWHFRDILTVLSPNSPFPLKTLALRSGASTSVTLVGGAAAYLTASVVAGETATVSWTTLPAGVQVTVVRTK